MRASIESKKKKERERQQQRIAYLYTPSGHRQEQQLKWKKKKEKYIYTYIHIVVATTITTTMQGLNAKLFFVLRIIKKKNTRELVFILRYCASARERERKENIDICLYLCIDFSFVYNSFASSWYLWHPYFAQGVGKEKKRIDNT